MPLPPKNNHCVTLAEASMLTAKYRNHAGIGAVKGGLFWKDSIERLLQQEGCVAMRYYYAQHEDGKPALVLVGVDKEGHDIIPGIMLDLSWPCPPFCDDRPHPLNRTISKSQQSAGRGQKTGNPAAEQTAGYTNSLAE